MSKTKKFIILLSLIIFLLVGGVSTMNNSIDKVTGLNLDFQRNTAQSNSDNIIAEFSKLESSVSNSSDQSLESSQTSSSVEATNSISSSASSIFNPGELDQETIAFDQNQNKLAGISLGDNTPLNLPVYQEGQKLTIFSDKLNVLNYERGLRLVDENENSLYLILSKNYFEDYQCVEETKQNSDLFYIDDIELKNGKNYIKYFYQKGSTEFEQINSKYYGNSQEYQGCYKTNSDVIDISGEQYYYEIVTEGESSEIIETIKTIFNS